MQVCIFLLILYITWKQCLGEIPVWDKVTLELPALGTPKNVEKPTEKPPEYTNAELLAKIASLERQLKQEKEEKENVKVSKFQNEFLKSLFLQKYELNIVRISALYCVTLQSRYPYNFWFIFWEKRWLHKFILKFTDL